MDDSSDDMMWGVSNDRLADRFGLSDDGDDSWMDRLREAEAPAILGCIGGYEVLEEISRGGQGIVYRAHDPETGRAVALKRLLAGSWATPTMRRRFEREVEAAASLCHPNIVTVFGTDIHDGQPTMAMEWIDGDPINRWTAGRATDEIVRLFIKVCSAVHHAHQRGVLHRDLKPSNILVDASGEPRVLDFGVAKLNSFDGTTANTVTRSGQFLGTPAYASPEQIQNGSCDMDVRSDVYALGVVLYELVTKRMPYDVSGTLAATFEEIQRGRPVRPRICAPDLPRDLEAIVLRAIEKDRGSRYQSVADLADDLDRYLRGEPTRAQSENRLYLLRKMIRRHRVPYSVGGTFLALFLGFGVTMLVMYRQAEREAEKAMLVQRFLEGTLTSARPYRSDGNVAILEMLSRASERVEVELRDQPEVEAGVRDTLARMYAGFWMWSESEMHARRALSLHEENGAEDATIAAGMTLLGRVRTFRRQPDAVDLQREALALRRRVHGSAHPFVAETLGNLAFALWKVDEDTNEAELRYDEALRMYDQGGGPLVAHRARTVYSAAAFHAEQENDARALNLFQRALEMYRQLPDTGDVYMVRCMDDCAMLLQRMGRYDEAGQLIDESLALTPDGFGQVRTSFQMWRLGSAQYQRGAFGKAEDLYRRTLRLSVERMTPKYPDLADAFAILAFQLGHGPLEQLSHEVYLDFFRTMHGLEGVPQARLMSGLRDLAATRAGRGDLAAAEALLRDGLAIGRDVLGPEHIDVAQTAGRLAEVLAERGQFEEAASLARDVHRQLRAARGPTHELTVDALDRLAGIYERWGRPAPEGDQPVRDDDPTIGAPD